MQLSPRTFVFLALSFLFSFDAVAQTNVRIRPGGPTTRTPVTLIVMVPYPTDPLPVVTIADRVIRLRTSTGRWEPVPPFRPVEVPLGLLPAGEYRIEHTLDDRTTVSTFIVRDAEPRPLTVTPFAVPITQVAPIQARISGGDSQLEPLCRPGIVCRVYVDGIEATNVRVDAEGHIWFVPPPRPRGLYRVGVDSANLLREAENAIYYFDRDAPPEHSIFERVLFPVLTEVNGQNGSRWITETTISNPRPAYVENYNEIVPFVCIDYPCGERFNPGELVQFEGGGYPAGVALLVPWSESPYFSFALRGRDVSRAAESYGTEIPVVRESGMFLGEMTMLNVPLVAGYRSKLRVYAFDLNPFVSHSAAVIIRRPNGAVLQREVPLTRNCSGRECFSAPWYGELDLPDNLSADADVYVRARSGAPAWSFISVTNNETQQVTLVTPDGRGGSPCDRPGCGGAQ